LYSTKCILNSAEAWSSWFSDIKKQGNYLGQGRIKWNKLEQVWMQLDKNTVVREAWKHYVEKINQKIN